MSNRPDALRPTTLPEFGGQPHVVRELGIVLRAAAGRDQLPDHVLLSGPPGLGKTTLAHIIANELQVPLVTTSGPAIEKTGDLAALLSSLAGPTVVFIDEIHRLPRTVEEILYPAMEDGVLDFIVGEGARARALRLPLKPFTLVGATTQVGMLSAPLRDRFGFTARMRLYDDYALCSIVERSAGLLGVHMSGAAALAVAKRSRGTPRVANAWLRRVRDFAQLAAADAGEDAVRIDETVALAALEAFDVDELGLDRTARDLLAAIIHTFGGGPVGLNTLASTVGESPETVQEVYEPHLLRCGLVARTRQGRVATVRAYEHLGVEVTAEAAVAAEVADDPAQAALDLDLG
jgi:Holliday junction DNA helicase RuvB